MKRAAVIALATTALAITGSACGGQSPAQKAQSGIDQYNASMQKALCSLDKATYNQLQIDIITGSQQVSSQQLVDAVNAINRDC